MKNNKQNSIKVVVLAGGAGTRLWPIARTSKPKYSLDFFGKGTMLQETVKRLRTGFKRDEIVFAVGAGQLEHVKKQLPGLDKKSIFFEPYKRDTAGAIGLAAIRLFVKDPQTIMVVANADHYVKEVNLYLRALKQGIEAVKNNPDRIALVGLKPEYPETGYGYIKIGKPAFAGSFGVARFVEKPDLKTAEKYMASGNYFWNPAMFIWRVDHLLDLYKKYLPDQYKILMKIKDSLGTKNEAKVVATEFAKIKPISIDYGILEKLKPGSMLMVPARFTWRDVGSWKAIHEVSSSHPKANVIKGKVVSVESTGNLVYSIHKEKMITLAGVEDMVVIDTEDTLFICPKEKSQMVKKIIEELKNKKDLNKFL